jgi:hypothetical protein
MTDELELVLVEGVAHISGVKDTEAIHLENEPSPLDGLRITWNSSLMDRNIVDQDIVKGKIDLIPVFSIIFKTSKNNRIPLGKPYIIMIPMLPPNRYDVRPYLGHGETHGSEWVCDDLGSSAGGDLEEGM